MTTSQKISAWFQYLYFLRFSILFWFFLPILALLDYLGYTTTITRAFMAPNSAWQAFHIAFFTVSLYMVVLVTARNFCMNGAERFLSEPPKSLTWLFCSPRPLAVWVSLGIAQIPTAITLLYVAYTARSEGEENFWFFGFHSARLIWLYLVLGILVALFFWYAVSLFYYWTYTEPKSKDCEKTPAKPLIFPHSFFGDLQQAPRPKLASILEFPLRLLVRFTYPGFAPGPEGPLWELHFLSFVSLLGFLLLYLFLYPLTAPIPVGQDLHIGGIVACVISLLFIAGIATAPTRDHGKWAGPVKIFFILLAIALATIFCLSAHEFLHGASVERNLPVLATILVICSFTLWAFGGLAFLLDRYRIPVFTTFLAIVFLPKVFHWTSGEHYFLAVDRPDTAVIPSSPAQALTFRTQDPSDPLIVITATGGGIHAAAWTTEILGRLEQEFASDPTLHSAFPDSKHYNFHDHVLLASGVSGGSVGLMSYLLEYTSPSPSFNRDRMTGAAACSSIEDVAWGLEYYDLVRLVSNVWFSRSGVVPPDRNWALTKAFSRNLNNPLCQTSDSKSSGTEPPSLNGETMTLGKGAALLQARQLPAFTLNTTAVETGGRFLLSNYQVSKNYNAGSDLLPSESFLHTYGEPCEGSDHTGYTYADLPIATAARLSATFPYVSSASRVPKEYAKYAYHFVDGGYYDNDGTASAIEFLNAALSKASPAAPKDPCVGPDPAPVTTTQGKLALPSTKAGEKQGSEQSEMPPLAILLIEIRNGDDLDPLSNVDDYNFQTHPENKHLWTALSQLTAPPGALWKAGHESVTRRNRLGLCLLETTYLDSLVIHHVIFNFDPASPSPEQKKEKSGKDIIQPLNWHLTAAELKQIRDEARDNKTDAAIKDAKEWIRKILNRESAIAARRLVPDDRNEACRIAWVRDKPVTGEGMPDNLK
jgi:hypothetical protein